MRTSSKLLFFVLMLGLTVACNNAPKGEKVEAEEAKEAPATTETTGSTTYVVHPPASQVIWTGSKLAGGEHTGTVALQSGKVNVKGSNITGGNFVIDMTSINNLDQKAGEGKEKLEGHLKSDDFFDVENFPTATFEITSATPVTGQENVTHNISGNLTMKDITKSITIPANVTVVDNQFGAVTPQFTIDRTQWDVKYRSGILGTAKDKIINDEIGLKLVIQGANEAVN